MARRFEMMDTNTRQYRRHNAVGRQITARLIPPSNNTNPVAHFLARGNQRFENALRDVDAADMVGITIQNQVKQNDKPTGTSFGRKDQLSGDVIWSVFEKDSQSNSCFNALGTMVVNVQSVTMTVSFGRCALKSSGRPLSVMAHLKKYISGR